MTEIAYTIGRTKVYDNLLASDFPDLQKKKVGKSANYEGGWVWKSFIDAKYFIDNYLEISEPEWKAEDFSVYKIELPNKWSKDVEINLNIPIEYKAFILLIDSTILNKEV